MTPLVDRFGRRVEYLRISLTDRCNLRCIYCVPPEKVHWKHRDEILSFEEIASVVEAAAQLGVRRIRLTGGEPLLRRDLPLLVHEIAAIPGIEEVSLTTNATLLEDLAEPLAKSGLRRVNVSLDTLRPDRYARLTRGGVVERVWRGIAAAERAALLPIKLNAVVIRGLNDDELEDLARLSLERPWHVRFIELMRVGDLDEWEPDLSDRQRGFLPVEGMLESLKDLELQPTNEKTGLGPARVYRVPGAQGTIGFISAISANFCSTCNRLRLTCDGRLRPCLLAAQEVDVREPIRRGEALGPYLELAANLKPQVHDLAAGQQPGSRWMAQIGG
ncbi:MAG: GTP 3',8-cyclase MoaA [Anaerolineales bacterium]|jgi:cyclic pyranopterin phosphate synthase